MNIYWILFIISIIIWIIIFCIYLLFEPNDEYSVRFRIWHFILIFISTLIPCVNVASALLLGALFIAILIYDYHIKDKFADSKIIKFLSKEI